MYTDTLQRIHWSTVDLALKNRLQFLHLLLMFNVATMSVYRLFLTDWLTMLSFVSSRHCYECFTKVNNEGNPKGNRILLLGYAGIYCIAAHEAVKHTVYSFVFFLLETASLHVHVLLWRCPTPWNRWPCIYIYILMCPISSFIVSCIKAPLIMPQCCDNLKYSYSEWALYLFYSSVD